MVVNSLFTSFVMKAKGTIDAYPRRISGHLQYVLRKFPVWSSLSHTPAHEAAAAGAKICNDAWHEYPCQLTRKTRFLFRMTSQTFFDWYRQTYQGFCIETQTAPPLPQKIEAFNTPAPEFFELEITAKNAISVYILRDAPAPKTAYIVHASTRRGRIGICLKRTRTYLTTFTQRLDIPAGASIRIIFSRYDTDAFSFIEPTPAHPSLSFIPITSNTDLYSIFSSP